MWTGKQTLHLMKLFDLISLGYFIKNIHTHHRFKCNCWCVVAYVELSENQIKKQSIFITPIAKFCPEITRYHKNKSWLRLWLDTKKYTAYNDWSIIFPILKYQVNKSLDNPTSVNCFATIHVGASIIYYVLCNVVVKLVICGHCNGVLLFYK